MNRVLLLLCITLLSGSFASAANQRRDGNWWRTQQRPVKLNYVLGIFDGIKVGQNFSVWGFMDEEGATADEARKRHFQSYETYSALLAKVTTGQISDGLDTFYSDFRNRSIVANDAFWPVLKTITGSPDDEVARLILNLRKSATNE